MSRPLLLLSLLLAPAAGQAPVGCEYPEGLQTYPDPGSCERYIRCANGTLTQEVCGNGLLFSGGGAVHEGCDYHWRVNCDGRPYQEPAPAAGPCPFAFGLFPSGDGCVDYFVKCAYGQPQPELCPEGLAYDERAHACNWPDLVPQCSVGDAETLAGYSCPDQVPAESASLRFGAFPRFATGRCDRLVTCVNYYPRITKCPYGKAVDESSLTCVAAELVPGCQHALAPAPPLAPAPARAPGPLPAPGPVPASVPVPASGPIRRVPAASGRIVAIEGPGLTLPDFVPGRVN